MPLVGGTYIGLEALAHCLPGIEWRRQGLAQRIFLYTCLLS
jgi:hypothetical protein